MLQWFVAVAMCVMMKHINMLRVPVKRSSQLWLPSKTTQEKVCCGGSVWMVCIVVVCRNRNVFRGLIKRRGSPASGYGYLDGIGMQVWCGACRRTGSVLLLRRQSWCQLFAHHPSCMRGNSWRQLCRHNSEQGAYTPTHSQTHTHTFTSYMQAQFHARLI